MRGKRKEVRGGGSIDLIRGKRDLRCGENQKVTPAILKKKKRKQRKAPKKDWGRQGGGQDRKGVTASQLGKKGQQAC